MPEILIDKDTCWECRRCGKCCTGLIPCKGEIISRRQDGKDICESLDEDCKSCTIYPQRPFICKLYPFVMDLNSVLDQNSIARPLNAFRLDKLRLHSECCGVGKGELILKNRTLQRRLEKLASEFARKFKQAHDEKRDISELL